MCLVAVAVAAADSEQPLRSHTVLAVVEGVYHAVAEGRMAAMREPAVRSCQPS